MKIFSYNVNGIRAAMNKGLIEWIRQAQCDTLCFQELKAMTDQFDVQSFSKLGYNLIWNSAEKKGYSGVALLSKEKPNYIKTLLFC